ncbi:MAG: 6-bladed beta-propeller [Candidatus Aquicultor sp.]
MQRISLRSFLITLLAILVVMTLILLYLYYLISRPPGMPPVQTKNMKHLYSIYGYGTKDDELLYRPTDVCFDDEGNIYIADTGRARVLEFRSGGQFLRKIGRKGVGPGELMEPVGVTTSKDGKLYVADKALSKVVIYDRGGHYLSEFKVMVPFKPYVANGKLYLSTYGHVIVYDLKGHVLAKWGHQGRAEGDMDSPSGLTVGKDGSVYISDSLNLRLEAFSRDGGLLWVKGKPAEDIKAVGRTFGLPCGIVMDDKNLLYLIDAFDNTIKVLTPKGEQIATLSKQGSREGELNLPSGIAFDQDGVFAIADKFNDRVQVVKITVE